MKSYSNISTGARILWSLLLAFILSGGAVSESIALCTAFQETEEQGLSDEEKRGEERVEDSENKTQSRGFESLLEGGDGGEEPSFSDKEYYLSHTAFSTLKNPLCCLSYAYYPHINIDAAARPESGYPSISFVLLYHRLVFYEQIS